MMPFKNTHVHTLRTPLILTEAKESVQKLKGFILQYNRWIYIWWVVACVLTCATSQSIFALSSAALSVASCNRRHSLNFIPWQ